MAVLRPFLTCLRSLAVPLSILFAGLLLSLAITGGAQAAGQAPTIATPAPATPMPTTAPANMTPVSNYGSISGVVQNVDGVPLALADVSLDGPTKAHMLTHGDGTFTFMDLLPGRYAVTASKGSFVTVRQADISVTAGAVVSLNVELQPATFTSLKVIGRITVTASGQSTINTSPAAVVTVPSIVFANQGQQQVTKVLNETPGIVTTVQNFGFNNNGAYPSAIQEPQIRGCLNYETGSLIDGHPIAIGSSGFYTPLYLNTYLLQNVELVKGPGSMPTDINYAVCGSVNYVTLEPTQKPQESIDLNYSSYNFTSSNFQATGTASRLGYAFDYAVNGQPGPFKSDNEYSGTLRITPTTMINGKPICGPALPYYVCGGSFPPTPANETGALAISYPAVICCSSLSDYFTGKSELGKLRYSFSPETSLTVAYLGSQAYQSLYTNYIFPQQTFDPYNPTYAAFGVWPTPSSGLYKGSLPPGFVTPYATLVNYQPDTEQNQQGLLESELRTGIGKSTFLLRYYTGSENDIVYIGNPDGTGVSGLTGQVWGLLPTGPGGAFQSYNGQTATISQDNTGTASLINDHFHGYSAELNTPAGSNLYTLSYDRTAHNSLYNFAGTLLVPNGASQALSTVMLRGLFTLTPQLTALFGNYFIGYTSHYTPNGGMTWADASRSFYGPRLALTFQPRSGTSIRASLGSSIAPPFLALINTAGGPPFANNQGAVLYYTQTLNNGNINPETAFGYDVGADQRFAGDLIASGDIYLTNIHGQFLSTESVNGTYTATSGPNTGKTRPLYVTETANLGQARSEGLELSVHSVPHFGFGFTAQAGFIRGYTYNLPAGFYNTAAGPKTTNLAIIPNVNYYGSGNGYNGAADGNVPYAQGYGEVNYRLKNNALFLVGTTYYGNNNSYDAPAFFTVLASAIYPLKGYASLQITGNNLTNVLSQKTGNLFGGQQLPLVNGTFGVTTLFNVGPPTLNIILHLKTGS